MATAEIKTEYTPEDLLTLPDGDEYELVDGQLVERSMGFESSHVGGRLFGRLFVFCEERFPAWLLPADASYQCFPDAPLKVRRPDLSLMWREKLSEAPTGHCRIAPDLAVEVISPNELYVEVEEKIAEYLSAGVRLIWVLNPEKRSVMIYRANGSTTFLHAHDELSGEEIVPGFRCKVAEIFAAPTTR
jgi:Uma2 family endonuclease